MKSIGTKLLQISFLCILALTACKKDKVAPVSERIKHSYVVQTVTHDGTTVYTSGATTNIIPSYVSFILNLKNSDQARLTEITGDSFTGSYSASESTLTLSNLTPQPTGSGGTLTYSINSISNDGKNLVLTTSKANPKTGNTINVYTLLAQD